MRSNLEKRNPKQKNDKNLVDKILGIVNEIERLFEGLERPLFKIIIILLSLIGVFTIFVGKIFH